MNHYELLAIVSGRFAENEVESQFGKIETIVKKHGGPIHYRQNLDRKRLAYPIEKQMYGYYFLLEFDSEPSVVSKIDRDLKLSADILRHNLVKRMAVGKPKTFERKNSLEQEAFGKTFDRAKLGLDDIQSVTRAEVVKPAPVAAQAPIVVDEKGATTPEVATVEEGQLPTAPSPEELIQSTPVESTAKAAKEKKTEQKVSFEELDAKLDDIFKNDIL